MHESKSTGALLAAMFVWPIMLNHDDQALMTIQCGLCGQDIMPADGWPTRYTFNLSWLNSQLFRHAMAEEDNPTHVAYTLSPPGHPYPCDAYRIGRLASCPICYAEGQLRDIAIVQADTDLTDPEGMS